MKFESIIKKVLDLNCFDPYVLSERLGIDLIYEDKLANDKLAKIFIYFGQPVIILPNDLGIQETFLIYHEIGHYILHLDNSINLLYNSNKLEYEANMFACLCLVIGNFSYNYDCRVYLKNYGVPLKIINQFQDAISQFKKTGEYSKYFNDSDY